MSAPAAPARRLRITRCPQASGPASAMQPAIVTDPRRDRPPAQRQLRQVERDPVLALEVAAPVAEDDDLAFDVEAAGTTGSVAPGSQTQTKACPVSEVIVYLRRPADEPRQHREPIADAPSLQLPPRWIGVNSTTPVNVAASNATPSLTLGSPRSTLRIVTAVTPARRPAPAKSSGARAGPAGCGCPSRTRRLNGLGESGLLLLVICRY